MSAMRTTPEAELATLVAALRAWGEPAGES